MGAKLRNFLFAIPDEWVVFQWPYNTLDDSIRDAATNWFGCYLDRIQQDPRVVDSMNAFIKADAERKRPKADAKADARP